MLLEHTYTEAELKALVEQQDQEFLEILANKTAGLRAIVSAERFSFVLLVGSTKGTYRRAMKIYGPNSRARVESYRSRYNAHA